MHRVSRGKTRHALPSQFLHLKPCYYGMYICMNLPFCCPVKSIIITELTLSVTPILTHISAISHFNSTPEWMNTDKTTEYDETGFHKTITAMWLFCH